MPTKMPRPRRVQVILTEAVIAEAGGFTATNGRSYSHGTINGYQTGKCRCALCKQASADYRYARLPTSLESIDPEPKRTAAWPEGLPIDRNFHREMVWMPAVEKADVSTRRFHDARASHISWLLAAGMPVPDMMDRAGHESYDTTKKYAKAMGQDDEFDDLWESARRQR